VQAGQQNELLLPDSGECRQAAVRFAPVKLFSRVILRRAELDRV